ncbi:MAG: hypothetical protein Q7R41_18870 [Phycisphaerales bacterium]|nr:hypothetical protein [Phycisphaerales bacterium]
MRRRVVVALFAVRGVVGGLSSRQGPGPGTPLSAESLIQQGDDWKKFYGNVATLPVAEKSTFIRSVSNRGLRFQFRNNRSGARASTRLNPIVDLISAYRAGRIDGYYDVIAMSK